MEQKFIFELIDKFEQSELTKLEIKDGDFSIKMENQPASAQSVIPAAPIQAMPMPMQPMQIMPQTAIQAATPAEQAIQGQADVLAESEPSSNLIPIKAPLVGVFYAAPSPDAPAYVKIGDKVEKGQVVCLVEAMKMMNELKSPADGIIRSVKGVNGELVEFEQILFEVEPC